MISIPRPLALLLPLACVACGDRLAVSPMEPGPGGPQPAADLLGDADRERNGVERKRWIDELHRAPDGVDWRAVERANADLERERRNRAVAAGLAPRGVWKELGSRNQAGHTRSVALGPRDADGATTLYVGSANGGVWRGDLGGRRWRPLGDGLFGGVDDVAALPGADGEDSRLLVRRGPEVFWSDDDGATWIRSEGLGEVREIRSLAVLADEGRTVLLLARRRVDGTNAAEVLASMDGGRSFAPRWRAAGDGDGDLWVPRVGAAASHRVYLTHKGRLFRSADGGESFEPLATFDGRSTAEELCGSEAGAPRLWVAAEVGGTWFLHCSDDGGESFERLGRLEDFWRALEAFPHDPDLLLSGGMECRRSTDGGRSFERVNAWGHYYADPATKLHADVRGIDVLVDPGAPDGTELEGAGGPLLFVSTDGGTYLSRDAGETFLNLSLEGLGVAQIYSTLTARDDPDLILAGTQDQGYQRGRRAVRVAPGPSTDFDQLLSGDYGYLTSTGGTHELVYSAYPGFVLVQEGAANPNLLYPWIDFPAGAEHAWMPPLVADPEDPEVFYLLGDRVYRYARRRGPYWGYRALSKHDFGAGEARYLTALAFAAEDVERVYAGDDVGGLWTSDDRGVSWRSGDVVGAASFRPAAISVHPERADRAVAVGSGYGGPGAFRTEDGGVRWRPLAAGLPATLLLDVVHARDGSGDLYAASDAGPLRWRAAKSRWEPIAGVEAPATTYWSVEWVDGLGLVRYGTYGRGIWDYSPARDVRPSVEAR